MADTELQNKLNAALRYAGTSAGTLFTVLGAVAIIPPESVNDLVAAVKELNQSIVSGYGALTKMWVILGPAAIFWLGKVGWSSSSVRSLGSKLLGIAKGAASPEAVEAQKTIVQATAEIARDKTIPAALEAKAAVLDAAGSIDEVVGDLHVTDPALVAATQSPQVKLAK